MKPEFSKTRLAVCISAMLATTGIHAAGQVSSVQVSQVPATPFTYSVGAITYNWGRGNNQIIDGFSADGRNYGYASSADDVIVQRDDIGGIASGQPCGVFVERLALDEGSRTYAADFPSDGSPTDNCLLEPLLESRIINRGVVDVFSNKLPDAKNIERLDYLFLNGTLAPIAQEQLGLAGHLVAEKGGNNPVKVAAVLSLDVLGQPAEYGPMVLVSEQGCTDSRICYGVTDLVHEYSFLQNEFNAPQSYPAETERSVESVSMAFVSASDLGLTSGQRYYGFSMFGDDVDASIHDLVDPRTFPDDTSDDYVVVGDDADVYGGLTGYFLADELNVSAGRLFLDNNMDGISDADEAGISDVTVSLFSDVNGNGVVDAGSDVRLGDELASNTDGRFVFPGIPDGNYLLVLDEADEDIPEGLVVSPGINPYPLTISGVDSELVSFSFINENQTDPDSNGGELDDGQESPGEDGETPVDGEAPGGEDGETPVDGEAPGGEDGETPVDGEAPGGEDGETPVDGEAPGGEDGETPVDGEAPSGEDGETPVDGEAPGGEDGDNPGNGGAPTGVDPEGQIPDKEDGEGPDSGETPDGQIPDKEEGDGLDGGPIDDGLQDDEATMAVADVVELRQGEELIIDVLANDIDGVGTGLTLLSASDSNNSTITTLPDGTILYVPDYGYYSVDGMPDTFTYTMQDADGDISNSTGNVSVTVNRFSDLDGNGQNDFTECDGCTDLYLETGLDGTGVGNISRTAILALFLLLACRLMARTTIARVSAKGGA